MKREILINGSQRETRVAILEDDRLVELLVDRPDHRRSVGDIYLGRVEAVLPGIQAAFVDIGQEKSAFLHASDLLEPDEDEEPEDEPADEPVPADPSSAEAVVEGAVEELPAEQKSAWRSRDPVSYTHLTLPTNGFPPPLRAPKQLSRAPWKSCRRSRRVPGEVVTAAGGGTTERRPSVPSPASDDSARFLPAERCPTFRTSSRRGRRSRFR